MFYLINILLIYIEVEILTNEKMKSLVWLMIMTRIYFIYCNKYVIINKKFV